MSVEILDVLYMFSAMDADEEAHLGSFIHDYNVNHGSSYSYI